MVAEALVDTDFVVIVKVPLLAPAAMLMEAGTVAEVLLLDRVTLAPPVGAAAVRVTVPVAEVPPVTLAGLTVTAERAATAAGVMVTVPALLTPA